MFDGTHCVPALGPSCSGLEAGAFDSLEECGITCARAGRCDLSGVVYAPESAVRATECGETPTACAQMGVRNYADIPSECAVWGPFHRGYVYATELPYPEQWDILFSLSLAVVPLGETFCERDP